MRDDVKVIQARTPHWELPATWGAKRWGENVEANDAAVMEFVVRWSVIPQQVKDLVANEPIDEIHRFDAAWIAAEARTWTPGR